MAREMRLREGAVMPEVKGVYVPAGDYNLSGDQFMLHSATGLRFAYRLGDGAVTIERPAGHDPAEEQLWLNGSVYAAVASINGLYPIHSSAVAWNGKVYAFNGPSGAGKSTLIAELVRQGLPLFCDDTLLLDLSDPARPMCLPGHKRLKLCPDALALTGAMAEEPVGAGFDKVYARTQGEPVDTVLPLAELIVLEEGDAAGFVPVSGAEKVMRLQDDHYTTDLYLAATRQDRATRFAQLVSLAGSLAMSRFVRPRDRARFASDAALARYHLIC